MAKEDMEIKNYERRIKALEEELIMANQRVDRIRKEKKQNTDKLANIPGVIGVIVRTPRSAYRIIKSPKIIKDIIKKRIKPATSDSEDKIKIIKSKDVYNTPHCDQPIEFIKTDDDTKRINLVTDSLDKNSLFGGVATSLIIATEFANKYDYELRIITRNSETNPIDYKKIMEINGLNPANKLSFYSDYMRDDPLYNTKKSTYMRLEIGENDIFMATSWWSAAAIDKMIDKKFFYLIQEVETFFYSYNDTRLLCEQIMKNKKIHFIVNSKYLYDYFKSNNTEICKNGTYFNPAFPKLVDKEIKFKDKKHYKLFFYARPQHERNLYAYGISILDKAIEKKIIDSKKWTIYCAGSGAQAIEFCDGTRSVNLGRMSWKDYANFLTEVDLGLSLMYTPHPSYPPYDIATSGGVVLSNKMYNKTKFIESKNVILSDLDSNQMLEKMKQAIALATNMKVRENNYKSNTICRDWRTTLRSALKYMEKCLSEQKN